MTPTGLPVVVRVKRKRDLDPVDTIVVEADETPAAKRRARDAALATELDAVLEGGLAGGSDGSKDADTRGRVAAGGTDAAARADIPAHAHRRRFRRVQMTLSLEDARNESAVRKLAQTVAEAASGRKRATRESEKLKEPHSDPKLSSKAHAKLAKSIRPEAERESTRVKRRATSLRRPAPLSSEIGAADAMVDHFRMYDLEAAAEEPPPSTSVAAATDAPDEGTLVADYLPMVAEFLGKDAPATKENGGEARDAFVYDVYVLENDDEAAITKVNETRWEARTMKSSDGVATETMTNEEATETSAVFAGGTEAALFFDFMDGLGDDDVSDADSQDSNREDAPDADYPDTEDSFSADEDEDAWGRERHANRNGGGYGFWPEYGCASAHGAGDGDSNYDADEGDDGLARAWNLTGTYRETAYDPQYDDVGGEETYYDQ